MRRRRFKRRTFRGKRRNKFGNRRKRGYTMSRGGIRM